MDDINSSLSLNDKVVCIAREDSSGKRLAPFVGNMNTVFNTKNITSNTLDLDLKGNHIATVNIDAVRPLKSGAAIKTNTPVVQPKKENKNLPNTNNTNDTTLTAKGIEQGLAAFLTAGSDEYLNYNMRLFGIPHQFTPYCDYRAYTNPKNRDKATAIGRKFIENIMLEAPVVTIIPGKPKYLPGNKDAQSTSYALLAAANNSMSNLVVDETVRRNSSKTEYQRYYDFQPDYIEYMKYVNILCAVGAAFLDLNNAMVDGKTKLSKYDWKNYRWNSEYYSMAVENVGDQVGDWVSSFVTYGKSLLKTYTSDNKATSNITAFQDTKEDQSTLESLENLLRQVNFVQFYIDANTSASESNDNDTAPSKLEGIFDSGRDLFKEIAFLANSGGIDSAQVQQLASGGIDALNEKLFSGGSTLSGLLSRISSSASNIIKGETMIFPEIYQSSRYTKNYSITVDLRTPYGNRMGYYLNILVPLFHLIALAVPRQSTANTYSSPFLIKCYYPGVFSCNLGIVKSLMIEKNPNNDSWSVDGYPTHIRATLQISDLYSDLNITPAGDIQLFIANSSLIEYISTCCGIDLATPQLQKKVQAIVTAITQGFESIDDSVNMAIFGSIENYINSLIY